MIGNATRLSLEDGLRLFRECNNIQINNYTIKFYTSVNTTINCFIFILRQYSIVLQSRFFMLNKCILTGYFYD